jgi:PiT family inorganic phosphate transporter
MAAAGPGAVHVTAVLGKVVLPALISPILAGVLAFVATRATYRLTARARSTTVNRGFRIGQVVSASTVALAHGTNDAQKTMGVITLTLISAGLLAAGSAPPFWVVLTAGLTIALGTYVGGWRIIRTLGTRISDIQTIQGFTAESTSGGIILASTHFGLPLSTTQVCTGAIFGAGAGRRSTAVHWGVGARLALVWTVTLPAAAVVGALASSVAISGSAGVWAVALGGAGLATAIYAASRRHPVTALNVNDVPASPLAETAV